MDQQDKKNFRKNDAPRGEKNFRSGDKKPYRKFDGEKKPYRKFDGDKKTGEKSFRDGEKKPYRKFDGDKKQGGMNRGGFKKAAPKKNAPPKPSARDVAFKAIRNVLRDNAYAAQALDRELSAVHLSDEDRRLAASIFYFTLENRLRIEKLLRGYMKERPEGDIPEILNIAAAQILFMDKIPDHAAVDEAVKMTRKTGKESMTKLVNGVLRNLIRDRDEGKLTLPDRETEPEKYISMKYSVALELVERLVKAYGVDLTEEIAAHQADRHADTIRPNRLKMTDAEFEAWLNESGLNWEKANVPGAYRITGAGKIASHEGYRKGMFSIQGESSMLAAYAANVKPGMQVLDACAAPGGKTCLMAEMMKGSGRVYAWDLHEHRAELIRAAAKRLELDNIRAQARDAAKRNENLDLSMDAVLIDAPCSGLGVMGDKPDIKYRLTNETIEALIPIQKGILETCAAYVKPGGLLVYSTCTIIPEENAHQIASFLEAHPEFEADNDASWLPENLRSGYQGGMIQLLNCRDGVEGFFIARLRRKAN